MSPHKASILIRYLLNEKPTIKQRDLVLSYVHIENDRKGFKFRSELIPLLNLRTLLFGNKKSFQKVDPLYKIFQKANPLYKTLKLEKDDVYDYVKSQLIEYLISLGFLHILQDFVHSDEPLHSPTIQKTPFVLDFDYNESINSSVLIESPKPSSSYWMPPLLNFAMIFDALYTTFSSTMNVVNSSINISLCVIKEWHNHIHQGVLEDEMQQPCRTR